MESADERSADAPSRDTFAFTPPEAHSENTMLLRRADSDQHLLDPLAPAATECKDSTNGTKIIAATTSIRDRHG
jgi:hypothetical protein